MTSRTISSVIPGQFVRDGSGVRIRRTIGVQQHDLDPFLMIDEIRSGDEADFIGGFPPHPHRGIETLTVMLAGGFEHRDHLGNHAELRDGGAQWLAAGRGVIHSEMPLRSVSGLHGFQIWINLPARDKLKAPAYAQAEAAELPWRDLEEGIRARIIAGYWILGGERAAAPLPQPAAGARVLELVLPAHAAHRTSAAAGEKTIVYVIDGVLHEGVMAGHAAIHGQGEVLEVRAGDAGAHVLLLAGTPIGEPIVQHGPFVMNTDEEIREAIAAYRSGTLTEGIDRHAAG